MVNGKATLLRYDYCDGLGDCLPTCPTGAISFVEREAAAYDEKAVQENMRKKRKAIMPLFPIQTAPAVECSVFNIQSVTVVRMEVPCCGGLELAAKKALQASEKFISWQIVTISLGGKILE